MNTIQWVPYSSKIRAFFMASLITIMSSISVSTYASERKTFTTFGARDCKSWVQDRQKALTGSPIDHFSAFGDTSWFLGYLSALNGTMVSEIDVLAAIDAKTAFLWVDRYCAQHPNEDLTAAAHGLLFELTKIEVKKMESRKNRSR